MSDPVTNMEIEDVLSSIRKLVAEEAPAPLVRQQKPEKLLLTPSQRVDPSDQPDKEEAPVQALQPVLLTESLRAEDLDLDYIPGDARLSQFGQVSGETAPESELPPEAPFAVAEPEETGTVESLFETDGDAEEALSRDQLVRLIEEEVSAALTPEHQEAPIAEPSEPAPDVEAAHDPWPVDDGAGSGDAVDETRCDDSSGDAPTEAEDTEDDAVTAGPEAGEGDTADAPAAPQSLEDKIAVLERLVAGDSDRYEEDVEEDEPAFSDMGTEDSWPEPQPEDHDTGLPPQFADTSNVLHARAWEQAAGMAPTDVTGGPDLPMLNDLELDEGLLRDMVAEIVRQELQGALGERITRNVRKLVRREIHRMLISQELE